jgi:hypothetical protein
MIVTDIWPKLIRPYAEFLVPAAYNLQQTLEGMGVNVDAGRPEVVPGVAAFSILAPGVPLSMVVEWVLAFALCLMVLSLLAGYCLGRGKGALVGLGLWCAPGLLSLLNAWPHYHGVPASFELGTSGAIGSPWGMVPIVIMGLLLGWCAAVVLTDLLRLRDRFQLYFDHAWIAIAVLTGVFFVSDALDRQNEQSLRDTTEQVRMSSNYLLEQVQWYERSFCLDDTKPVTAACKWAGHVQPLLADYAYGEYQIFWSVGPLSDADLYTPYAPHPAPERVAAVRKELESANQSACGDAHTDHEQPCRRVPASLCNPDRQHYDNVFKPVVIANECIVPSLVRLHDLAQKQHAVVAEDTASKHWRHLYYMLFSVLAGAKIAMLTVRARKVGEHHRMLELMRQCVRLLIKLALYAWRMLVFASRTGGDALRRIRRKMRKASELPPFDVNAPVDGDG